jgi:hypothetical protein
MVPAQVYVYPNPTNNTLDFHASENIFGNITYEVVDLNGRTLISKSTNVNKNSIVDIEGVSLLPAGIYFLKVISPSATHINKFIKN